MPQTITKTFQRNAWGRHPGACMIPVLLLVLASAGPAAAGSPWEGIATMLASRARMAPPAVPTVATSATLQQALPVRSASVMPPVLREVPDEVSATSASQARPLVSAALALESMTTATAAGVQHFVAVKGPGNKPQAIDLGRESDENEKMLATDLFKNNDIRRLLGDEVRFVYNPEGRSDPMVVPWVRRAAIFKELKAQADVMMAAGDYDRAVEVYKKILLLNDPRFNAEVNDTLHKIAEKQNTKALALVKAAQPVEEKIELPAWIHDNTTGVIVSPGSDMCLVGEYMLKAGDTVPNYPGVSVASIASQKVVYQIRNRSFEVQLNSN